VAHEADGLYGVWNLISGLTGAPVGPRVKVPVGLIKLPVDLTGVRCNSPVETRC
jgi:hypothetical protein